MVLENVKLLAIRAAHPVQVPRVRSREENPHDAEVQVRSASIQVIRPPEDFPRRLFPRNLLPRASGQGAAAGNTKEPLLTGEKVPKAQDTDSVPYRVKVFNEARGKVKRGRDGLRCTLRRAFNGRSTEGNTTSKDGKNLPDGSAGERKNDGIPGEDE